MDSQSSHAIIGGVLRIFHGLPGRASISLYAFRIMSLLRDIGNPAARSAVALAGLDKKGPWGNQTGYVPICRFKDGAHSCGTVRFRASSASRYPYMAADRAARLTRSSMADSQRCIPPPENPRQLTASYPIPAFLGNRASGPRPALATEVYNGSFIWARR